MKSWFLCRLQYLKALENDQIKKITEEYLVDAVSPTDAEKRLYHHVCKNIRDFEVISIKKENIKEVVEYESFFPANSAYHLCKMQYMSVDERYGKEKAVTEKYLVDARNPRHAYDRLENLLSTMIVPYDITDVNTSKILEVIHYQEIGEKNLREQPAAAVEIENDGHDDEQEDDRHLDLHEIAETTGDTDFADIQPDF